MPYKNNIQALMKKNPRLAQIIDGAKLTGRYAVTPSQRKDKLPSLIDFKLNKNFYNNIDPFKVAELDIAAREINLPDLAVFLGFGMSYEIHEYLHKYPHARILIFENDAELLKTVFSALSCTDIINSPNVRIVGGEDTRMSYPEIFKFFNIAANMYFLKAVNIIEQPVSYAGNKEYYISAIRMVKEAIQQVLLLYGNDPYDSLLGIKFTLRNLSTIIDNPGIKDLEGAFKGKPGIVIASGPSLDKNIHLLEGLRNKAVMCAADGSVKILKHHNLPPAHLVTSLERVIATSFLFEGLTPEDTQDSYLAACPVIVPETYANFPGEKIIVYRNFATFEWLDIKKGIVDIGPSAGNMAFKVLEYLGCDPIIMIGQDLALKDDLTTHAEGFHYKTDLSPSEIPNLIEVEGNYQPKVKTRPVYKQFLLHYERDMATYKGTAINATEGGAKIHGAQVMTFQEAIDKYIKNDINVSATIKNKLKPIKDKAKKEQIKETLKKLYHANKYCEDVIGVCADGLELCLHNSEIFKSTDMKPEGDMLEKCRSNILKMAKLCDKFAVRDFYLILMHYVQSFYIKAVMDINSIRFKYKLSVERDAAMTVKYQELFSVLGALIKKLMEEFKVSIELLEKFQKEFNEKMEKKKG